MPDTTRPLRDLVLSDAVMDRDALARSRPELLVDLLAEGDARPSARVLELRGDTVPVRDGRLAWRAPEAIDRQWYDDGGVVLYLGRDDDGPAVAVLRPAPSDETPGSATNGPSGDDSTAASGTPDAPTWHTLREVGLDLPPADVACATAAVALTHWHAAHQHCPRCGAATEPREAGWVRRCLVDGSQHFPRTDPAVIMAVVDHGHDRAEQGGTNPGETSAAAGTESGASHPGDATDVDGSRILLARGARWKGPHRSVLAGFVEPGESFEQAVARETLEESGVTVTDVRYLGSQPWPFPASLMVGCVARATSTQLRPQEGEIEEIGWYTRADIDAGLADGTLSLPGRLSIARALIEHWYGGPLPEPKQEW